MFDVELLEKLKHADYVLMSIAPVNGEDIVLKHLSKNFKFLNLKWITYLSAKVYTEITKEIGLMKQGATRNPFTF